MLIPVRTDLPNEPQACQDEERYFLEQQKQQKSNNRTDKTKTWKCSFLRLPSTVGKINTTHEKINITNKSKLDLFQWLYLVYPKYLNN